MEAHSEKPTPVWAGPLSQHVGRHVQQRTVPMGIILRHETVQETGIQDQFQIRFEPDVTQACGQPIGFHAMLAAHDGNLIVNEERQIDETMALRSIDTDITIHPGRSETNAFLSQHVGGHGRQTMVLMPIRHVQYAAEPYRIRVNDKIGT